MFVLQDHMIDSDGSTDDMNVDLKPLTKKFKATTLEEFCVPNSPDQRLNEAFAPDNPAYDPFRNATVREVHEKFGGTSSPTQMECDEYNPELDERSNPFYFSTNRLLYEAHAERQRRFKWNQSS